MLSSARVVFGDAQKTTFEDEHLLHYFVQTRSSHISNYKELCAFRMEVTDIDSWVLMSVGLDASYIQAIRLLLPPPCMVPIFPQY